jgi:hypothetical protein
VRSSRRIVPELQALAVGDVIPVANDGTGLRVRILERERVLGATDRRRDVGLDLGAGAGGRRHAAPEPHPDEHGRLLAPRPGRDLAGPGAGIVGHGAPDAARPARAGGGHAREIAGGRWQPRGAGGGGLRGPGQPQPTTRAADGAIRWRARPRPGEEPVEIAPDVFLLGPWGRTQTNVYLVRAGAAWALVDAGWEGDAARIEAAARTLLGPGAAPRPSS